MSEHSARYWLLDWYGRMMDHDVVQDRIEMRDLAVDRYPGIWFTCDDPDRRPLPIHLHKAVSLPSPLPRLVAIDAGDGRVALRDEEAEKSGRTGPYAKTLPWGRLELNSQNLAGWECFAIVSDAMLHGILILAQPSLSEIRDAAGAALPPLNLIEGIGCTFGDIRVPVAAMRPVLEGVAALTSGEDASFVLACEPAHEITVRRL